jgi:ribosome biogenesis GTPase YqeH
MSKKCQGCGIVLQSDNKEIDGFINNTDNNLCKRCYELKNFNRISDVSLENKDFINIIKGVGETKALVVWVIDVFDFEGTYMPTFEDYFYENPIILVINKIDIIPKAVDTNKIKRWVIDNVDVDLDIVDVIITSAKKNINIDYLVSTIKEFTKKDAYLVGVTNTGKSSLINQLIKSVKPEYEKKIITSFYSGTTLGKIKVPLSNKINLIDTPGIINDTQITKNLSPKSLKHVIPNGEIRPVTYQLNSGQTLFLTGLVRFDFVDGEKTSFTVYCSNNINIHRTKTEKALQLLETHMGKDMLYPPSEEELKKIAAFKTVVLEISEAKTDIVINGIGWITVNSIDGPLQVQVTVPQNTGVSTRNSIIGG